MFELAVVGIFLGFDASCFAVTPQDMKPKPYGQCFLCVRKYVGHVLCVWVGGEGGRGRRCDGCAQLCDETSALQVSKRTLQN